MAARQRARPSNADPSIRTSPPCSPGPCRSADLADLRGLTGGRGSCAGRFCLRRADTPSGRESALKSGTLATSSPSCDVAQRRGMDIACESCRRSDRCAHLARSGAAQAATLGDLVSVQFGGAARRLGKRYRLWNVMASSSCAGPVLPPAVRRGACGGRGLPMGSWRSVRAGGSCLAARRRSPVSRASPLTARLGDRADHGDRARGLTAGDAQLRCRGARHVPGLHQRPASADQIGGTVRLLVDLLCHPTAC